MSKSKLIAGRLRELFLDGHWIANTNYKELLSDISIEQANHRTGNLNTIALLTFHINYYLSGLLGVFNGGKLNISDKYSFDMPPLQSEDDWRTLVNQLLDNANQFADKITQISDAELDGPFVDIKYGTNLRNIEGVIEHSYYHLGQIVMLRKIQRIAI